ncbi:MAG: hypothetical protein GVY24_07850 [Planctomycetes bacterium]|jgi:hypothetical protein|nr:hypothetical protein [Planctomycetota bacterium]
MFEWPSLPGAMLYRPPLPMMMVIIGLGLAALVWGWLYLRRSSEAGAGRRGVLIACRVAALVVLLWLLLGPSAIDNAGSRATPPTLDILLDTSASMAQTDARPDDPTATRLDAVRNAWLNPDNLAQLDAVSRPRLYAFDRSPRALTLSPAQLANLEAVGDRTRLLDAVARVHAAPADDGVTLVLSDGHDTRGGADEALLRRLAATGRPIFAAPVGQVRDAADLAVQAWAEADFLFDGQQTTLNASLIQRGLDGRRATLELFAGQRLIASRPVTLDEASSRQTFTITAEAEPGRPVTPRHYRLRATLDDTASAAPEAYRENNTAHVFVQVSRQRIRVALFEGRPYWDTQALARVLAADPQIELTAVYQLAPQRHTVVRDPRAAEPDKPLLPIDQATLNDFDVVILGHACEAFFGGARGAMLEDYVRQRGGALVLARGKPFDDTDLGRAAMERLEPLLPVRWGEQTVRDLRLSVTDAGRENPLLVFDGDEPAPADAVITRLPGMIAATRVRRERAASLVLLRQSAAQDGGRSMAAVATQRVGGGRVLAVLSDGLWRWSLLPPRFEDQSTVYHVFWSRAIQWLATGGEFLPGQEVSLSLDRLSAEPGQPIEATVATRYVAEQSFLPRLRVIGPDGQARTLEPQRAGPQSPNYRAVIEGEATGVYRIELYDEGEARLVDPAAPLTTRFAVADRSIERQDPSARPQVLQALADATGGACLGLDEADRLIDHLQSVHAARQRDVEPRYDFAYWPVLATIAGVLGLEWFLRRRVGLL